MNVEELRKKLFDMHDAGYRDFQSGLIPTVPKEDMIGVRTPALRQLAREIQNDNEFTDSFLSDLPHRYFEENQLHAFIVSSVRDTERCISLLESFLPYVNNWATCDQMKPAAAKRHKTDFLSYILRWLKSDSVYTVRFAILMLMDHFLEDDFSPEYPKLISEIKREDYYIRMMAAWYFATGLAKQYDSILPFFQNNALDVWTHNKAIQKAVESRRITAAQKEYLRNLKRKNTSV